LVVVNFWGLREARDWRFRGGIYTRAEPLSIAFLINFLKGRALPEGRAAAIVRILPTQGLPKCFGAS